MVTQAPRSTSALKSRYYTPAYRTLDGRPKTFLERMSPWERSPSGEYRQYRKSRVNQCLKLIKTQYLTKLGTDTATAPQTNVSRSSLVEEVRLVECD
jgi:hypothetical protein